MTTLLRLLAWAALWLNLWYTLNIENYYAAGMCIVAMGLFSHLNDAEDHLNMAFATLVKIRDALDKNDQT